MAGLPGLRCAAAGLTLLGLAGCAAAPQPSAAEQANLANCTAQADAVYAQSNLNGLARTGQNGLLFPAQPQAAFQGQRMGTLNARHNQIQACMEQGDAGQQLPNQAPLPKPQILPQS